MGRTHNEVSSDKEIAKSLEATKEAAEMRTSARASGSWSGAVVGALAAAVVSYANLLVPYLVALPQEPGILGRLPRILIAALFWSLVFAGGGGVAGWIAARSSRLVAAALKGAMVLLAVQSLIILGSGNLDRFLVMPLLKIGMVLVNASALGAIAGSVGAMAGRARRRIEDKSAASLQYRLSDLLFLMAMCAILFGSLAMLSR